MQLVTPVTNSTSAEDSILKKVDMFSSAVSQIDCIYIRFENLSSKAFDCVKSEELNNISSENLSTHKHIYDPGTSLSFV